MSKKRNLAKSNESINSTIQIKLFIVTFTFLYFCSSMWVEARRLPDQSIRWNSSGLSVEDDLWIQPPTSQGCAYLPWDEEKIKLGSGCGYPTRFFCEYS